jgi:2-polyprenyl-6-methoxyphenol hydroxylase-like FAD-dependent oxidoreductase
MARHTRAILLLVMRWVYFYVPQHFLHFELGADGIRSIIRSAVLPTLNIEPRPTGESAYRLLIPLKAISEHHDLVNAGFLQPRLNNYRSPTRVIVTYPCHSNTFLNVVAFVRASL